MRSKGGAVIRERRGEDERRKAKTRSIIYRRELRNGGDEKTRHTRERELPRTQTVIDYQSLICIGVSILAS